MQRLKALAHSPMLPCILALLAILLGLPALWAGLRFDDWLHWQAFNDIPGAVPLFDSPWNMFSFGNADPEHARALMDRGFFPWWTNENILVAFWRPVSVLSHYLDHLVLKDQVALMHLHSLIWFAAGAALITRYYRKRMGLGWAAALAALMFLVDDSKAVPVAWLANRNTLIAGFFGIGVLLTHARWRETKRLRYLLFSLALLCLGLLAKEEALASCAYLFAFALFLDEGSWPRRLLRLAPYAVLVILWRLIYSGFGYGALGSQIYIDPVHAPIDYLLAASYRLPLLLAGQWCLPDPSPFVGLSFPATLIWVLCACACVLAILFLLWPLLKRDAYARYAFLGMLLSLAPACATFPSARLLFFPAIGAMGLLARLMETAFAEDFRLWGRAWRRPARILLWSLILLHVFLAPLLLPAQIIGFSKLTNLYTQCIRTAPLDESIRNKTLVVINAPNLFLTSNIFNLNALEGRPIPERIVNLNNFDLIGDQLEVERLDERTLRCRPRKGYRWYLMRNDHAPLPLGTVIALEEVSIEVTAIHEKGWPAEVIYHFKRPLEDSGYHWIRFNKMRYENAAPPAIGETRIYMPYS